jgi:hypothetical protein
MGRILLIAAAIVVGFFVIGAVIGFIFSALKWLLIVGVIALAVAGVLKLTRSAGGARDRDY